MSWWDRFFGGDADRPRRRVPAAAAAQMQRQGAVLVDVREQREWSAGRAPKARHIPLNELASRTSELSTLATVLTICRTGHRSARAAAMLRRAGYTVVDVAGGMRAWSAAGLPVVVSGGKPGRVV